MNKASGGDGIPVELFQNLKDDAVKVLHSICQQIWMKKASRGLSRVEAGNPGFPRLVQVTSGGFSWWL